MLVNCTKPNKISVLCSRERLVSLIIVNEFYDVNEK
jgi:hypothetical protein